VAAAALNPKEKKMSDTETVAPESTPTPESNNESPEGGRCGRGGHCQNGRCGHHGRRRGGFFRRIFGATLFLGFLVGVPLAVAHAAGVGGCGPFHHDAPKSAEELREHMGKGAGYMLDKVDATDAQTAQVDAVLDRVAPQLWDLKDDHDALRQDFRAALTAPEVNADEVETLRKEGLALADEASKIAVGGIVDVARALTPEQRTELADAAAKFHGE